MIVQYAASASCRSGIRRLPLRLVLTRRCPCAPCRVTREVVVQSESFRTRFQSSSRGHGQHAKRLYSSFASGRLPYGSPRSITNAMISPRYTLGSLEEALKPCKPKAQPLDFVKTLELVEEAPLRDASILDMWWRYTEDYSPDLGSLQVAVEAIALHNRILADPSISTLAVYTDGSLMPRNGQPSHGYPNGADQKSKGDSEKNMKATKNRSGTSFYVSRDVGAGAVIPALCEVRLSGLAKGSLRPHTIDQLGATFAEVFALVIGLEGAVDAVSPATRRGQRDRKYDRVAVFTDYSGPGSFFSRTVLNDEPFIRRMIRQAAWSLTRLDQLGVRLEVYWLPKRYSITGNRLAHDAAQRAARKQLSFTILNTKTWQRELLKRAVNEARRETYSSDVG